MVAAGVVVAAGVAATIPDTLVGVFYDDGIYAALARNLAEGGGYRVPYLPGQPPGVHYPFGYPAFLALLWLAWPSFPDNVVLLRGANAVLLGAFAALTTGYLGSRIAVPRWLTMLAVCAACLSVPMLAVATVLFAEPLFLALAAGALWCADASGEREGRTGWVLAVTAGLLAGASQLTRSIGAAVVFGVVVALLLSRRPQRAVVAFALALACVIPWALWTAAHQGATDSAIAANYGTYGQLLEQGGSGLLSPASLVAMARPLAALALPRLGTATVALGVIALVVLAAGWWELGRRARAAQLMLPCYLAVVMTWPYGPDRFLWAIVPWLAPVFALGVWRLWQLEGAPRSRAALRAVTAAAAVAVAAGYASSQWTGIRAGGATAAQREISDSFREVLPWIREQTGSSAVIATEDEALVWLYTGRRAVPSYVWRARGRTAESLGPDSLRAWLDRSGATHLMLMGPGSDAAPTIDALLQRHPGYLRVVRSWPWPILAFEIQRGV
jgi:hypothetical protein